MYVELQHMYLLPYLLARHQLGTINRQLKSSAEKICRYLNVLSTIRTSIFSQLPDLWPAVDVNHCSETLETLLFVNDWQTQFVKCFVCLTSEFWTWFSVTFLRFRIVASVLEQYMQASEITMLCVYAPTVSVFEPVGPFSHSLVRTWCHWCRPNALHFILPQSVMTTWQTHEILWVLHRVDKLSEFVGYVFVKCEKKTFLASFLYW